MKSATLRSRGTTAFCLNDFEESLKCFLLVIEQQPRDWESHIYLAMTYQKLGMQAQAQDIFQYVYLNCDDVNWIESARLALSSQSPSAPSTNAPDSSDHETHHTSKASKGPQNYAS